MFGTLENRLVVDGTLVARTGLRIGTGRADAPVGSDLPVLRDAYGKPFIPGSSLKGALRSYLEARLRGMAGVSSPLLACDPTREDEDGTCLPAVRIKTIKEESHQEQASVDRSIWEQSCCLCQTFGSPWLASHVQIRDLTVVPGQWIDQFTTRDGVAIDRDKGTAANKKLYSYEVIPAGTPFVMRLIAENLETWQLGLLWVGIRALEQKAVPLGGFTSRGLGWVELAHRQARFIEAKDVLVLLASDAAGTSVEDSTAQAWVKDLQEEVQRRVEERHA